MEIKNEMGVIVFFTQQAETAGYSILDIRSIFPDALVSKNGKVYRTEFEYLLSSFFHHNHDERECDLVICWRNDTNGFVLPVLELSDPDWMAKSIALADEIDKELAYWKRQADRYKGIARNLQTKLDSFVISEDDKHSDSLFACYICEQAYETQQALNAHMRRHK